MTKLRQFPIYPSQLPSFKKMADFLAFEIEKASNEKRLSAFKRYDYLSQSLGYDGHSSLIQAAKFRSEADQNAPFFIANDKETRNTLIYVFCVKHNCIDEHIMHDIIDKALIQPGSTNSCSLLIDVSNAPHAVQIAFRESPVFSRLFHSSRDAHVALTYIEQSLSDFNSTQKQTIHSWKIKIIFDNLNKLNIVNEWHEWQLFKQWLGLFDSTERFTIHERNVKGKWSILQSQHIDDLNYFSFQHNHIEIDLSQDKHLFELLKPSEMELVLSKGSLKQILDFFNSKLDKYDLGDLWKNRAMDFLLACLPAILDLKNNTNLHVNVNTIIKYTSPNNYGTLLKSRKISEASRQLINNFLNSVPGYNSEIDIKQQSETFTEQFGYIVLPLCKPTFFE